MYTESEKNVVKTCIIESKSVFFKKLFSEPDRG